MTDTKKPVTKSAPDTTAAKPATAERRPSLPSLSPLPGDKPTAADAQPAPPGAPTTAPEKPAAPASAPAEATTAPTPAAKPAKPTETLAPKLRAKAEIIAALRTGAHLLHTEGGLYRIVEVNGTVHPASKRRILSLIQQGILKASGEGNGRIYILDPEAEAKASEKKSAVKQEAPASGTSESGN